MNARWAFRSLLLAAAALLGVVLLAAQRLEAGHGLSVPPGYALTLCGQLLASTYGLTSAASRPTLLFGALVSLMILGGLTAALRTLWVTRAVVGRLTSRPSPTRPDIEQLAVELGLSGRLIVAESDQLYSFCFGLLRPRVCVSTALVEALEVAEIRAVLAHERFHAAERDPLRVACANVLAVAAFPFPLVAALRRTYLVARELDADRAAITVAGQRALAGALHKVLTHPHTLHIQTAAAIGSISACSARLDQVLRPEVPGYPRIGRAVIASSVLVMALLTAGLLEPGHGRSALEALAMTGPASPLASAPCEMIDDTCTVANVSSTCPLYP